MNAADMSGIIALTGGIGSGKSTVAQVLRAWGYAVFDCDIRARILMDEGVEIKRRIAQEIAAEVIENGAINRRTLSDIVFADKEKLLILNNIVHSAVRKDIRNWRSTLCNKPFVFVETAILSRELRISALTVKKAYDALEQEGFIVTVHGKGSFVAVINKNVALEEQRREVEAAFEEAIRKARSCGMTKEEISQLLDIMMED